VGPLEWIGPATDAEILRAGRDGKGVILAPVAFVSEHSETLVELDIEYRKLAHEVPDYRRAATVGTQTDFINGLAALVRRALASKTVTCGPDPLGGGRICPADHKRCGYN
jgi:ferrochelatase